jgi:DNA polymerase-4
VRCIAHVDMDAFYVSVELQRRPDLRGLPVVVAGTASRARRLCPEAVFLPPDFKLYRARSQEVMAVLRDHIDRVEVVGLDEAYLDLTQLERPKAAARRVVAAVRERTGLCCSIGMGPSKLVAKVASDAEKPNGFVVLTREQACERFAGSPPGLIPGIGPKTAARLADQGIDTLGKLAATSETELSTWFGPRLGPHLRRLACFEHESPLTTVRVAKSESRETTFDQDLHGLATLTPVLERLSAELCETLARGDRRGPTIGIKVRLDDFSTHTRARTVDAPTNDRELVTSVALELLREFDPPRPVRLLGVRVAGLDRATEAAGPGDDQMALAV